MGVRGEKRAVKNFDPNKKTVGTKPVLHHFSHPTHYLHVSVISKCFPFQQGGSHFLSLDLTSLLLGTLPPQAWSQGTAGAGVLLPGLGCAGVRGPAPGWDEAACDAAVPSACPALKCFASPAAAGSSPVPVRWHGVLGMLGPGVLLVPALSSEDLLGSCSPVLAVQARCCPGRGSRVSHPRTAPLPDGGYCSEPQL